MALRFIDETLAEEGITGFYGVAKVEKSKTCFGLVNEYFNMRNLASQTFPCSHTVCFHVQQSCKQFPRTKSCVNAGEGAPHADLLTDSSLCLAAANQQEAQGAKQGAPWQDILECFCPFGRPAGAWTQWSAVCCDGLISFFIASLNMPTSFDLNDTDRKFCMIGKLIICNYLSSFSPSI